MGSGYGTRKCRTCERDALSETDTNYSLNSVQCFYCGDTYEEYLEVDRKREKETGEQYYRLNKDGKFICRVRNHIGYGAYKIDSIKGAGVAGSISKPLTPKDIEKFRKAIESPEIDQGKSYLLSFDPTTKELTAVFGKIPKESPF